MDTPEHFRDIWRHINGKDWSDSSQDHSKAYATSLVSELVYLRIPEFEIEGADRANIIPAAVYKEAFQERSSFDFYEVVGKLDFGQVFLVERRYVVCLGIVTPSVIFLAFRGTQYAYDWLANLNALRIKRGEDVYFHKGFYRAITACYDGINRELAAMLDGKEELPPIIATGHSLGGAMAAILNAEWEFKHNYHGNRRFGSYRPVPLTSCYTFGMPKYGNMGAVLDRVSPYHYYNDKDIVPQVPPSAMGYANCLEESRLDGVQLETTNEREIESSISWIRSLMKGEKVEHHSIELYRERLASFAT